MESNPPPKTAFDLTCSQCGTNREFAKVPAKKGQRRMRICPKCDAPGKR